MIYIVAGMHRSGTSLVGGLLHKSGVSMGSSFRKALPENPKGFFEDEGFRVINDRLLRSSGYEVKEWLPNFTKLEPRQEDYLDSLELVRRRIVAYESWGWKDPRNCLTLPFWIDALNTLGLLSKTKFIIARRDRMSVVKSMKSRGNVESSGLAEKIIEMYERHMFAALRVISRGQCLELHYEALLFGEDVKKLEDCCGHEIARDFIDRNLNHWSENNTV